MTTLRKFAQAVLSLTMILSMLLSVARVQPVAAQQGDGVRRQRNAETGKVSFLGPTPGRSSVSAKGWGYGLAKAPADPGMALAKRFGPEFGVENPERDLTRMQSDQQENGRMTVRYQQTHQGIPVMGGELVVNTNKNGDLYSMNGEVAQDLSLDTQPALTAARAVEIAKRGMVKWYGGTEADYQNSEPALWIFDEQLFRPSIRPVELVWRMEMTPLQQGEPIRELVLVSAKTGNIPLHFNQIDTGWGDTQAQEPTPTEPPVIPPTETPVPEGEAILVGTSTPTPGSILPEPAKLEELTGPREGYANMLPDGDVEAAFTGTTRYVATTGTASSGCTSSSNPCSKIQYAINSSVNGDIIKVAEGTYSGAPPNSTPNVVILNKGVLLSGGWDSGFVSQTGAATIDGSSAGIPTNNGLLVTASSAAAMDRFIIQNSKSADSGAIYLAVGTNFTLTNSTLRNNTATGRGAGIFVIGTATLTVINSTISHNTAGNSGGGIQVDSGPTVNIEYSTIAYNTATNGGGGVYRNGNSTLNVHNSILANNTNSTSPNCNSLSASDYNIISSTDGCSFTAGSHDQIDIDPQITSSLVGPAQIHYLLSGSPAIDTGELGSCTANTESRDQRGVARPQGSNCDVGAVEYNGPGAYIAVSAGSSQKTGIGTVYATNLSAIVSDYSNNPISDVTVIFTAPASGASGTFTDSGTNITTAVTDVNGIATAAPITANSTPGAFTVSAAASGVEGLASFQLESARSWYVSPAGNDTSCGDLASPCLTIQQAVNNAAAGDLILIQTGTYTSTTSNLGVVSIAKNLNLSGGWNSDFTTQNDYSIIDGQAQRRGIKITAGIVDLDHFVIQNGNPHTDTSYDSGGNGGGIFVANATLTVSNFLIKDNVGQNTSATYPNQGAGIYASNAYLTVNNTTISGNKSRANGAGISFIVGQLNRTLLINNSTIAGNESSGLGGGGGIYISDPSAGYANKVIRNSILANNTATPGPNCRVVNSTIPTLNFDHSTLYGADGCIFTQTATVTSDPKLSNSLVGNPGHYALFATSPALDAGDPATCLLTDQRGVSRPQGSLCDMGAFEKASSINPSSLLGTIGGNNQRVIPSSPLPVPFSVSVLDSNGDAVSGVTVVFTAPSSGASGTFENATNTTTTVTDAAGLATSSTFTTNGIPGSYTISAVADGLTASFQVTNIVWYVSPSGSSACILSDPHCTTMQAAINSATAGDTIWVEKGTYLEGVQISKDLTVKGGWNSTFTTQDGQTIIDGENLRRNVTINSNVTAFMDRFDITRGKVVNANGGGILSEGVLTFTNGAIYSNVAHGVVSGSSSNGGAIYVGKQYGSGLQLILTNVTISNNEADTGGGLFIANSGSATLTNVTITQNFATNLGVTASGGGIRTHGATTITNSIIAGNAAEEGQDCFGTLTSGGNNLIGFNMGCTINPAAGDQIGTQLQPIDAKLGDLGDNGSYTKTHALLTGSPAIDAGNPATCAASDQRGVARPQGAACDIGAFEGAETQTTTANVKTYTAGNSAKWPGNFLCDITSPDCTTSPNDPVADSAHQHAIGAYDFYLTTHGRKGIDNNNMPIVSTVHYCSTTYCPYPNAFWSGAQMVYGDAYGFANADDIVMHELTHGVTQYESNLFYFYQSGAISESFSDLWGEYYDQTNTLGNDTPGVKWLLGEDTTGLGAMRSMNNPPAYGDPDKMTSTLYIKVDDDDSGGVHSNSGVNNKAVFLMVDGGTFNTKTVTGLGWLKTGTIYYEAQTNLLTSGSDYSDLYYALQQACTNVTGTNGITPGDCLQVRLALDAVQMNSQPVAGYNPDASLCPTGMTTAPAVTLFEDSFEDGANNWITGGAWKFENYYAASGSKMMWGDDETTLNDSSLAMLNGVTLPAGSTPFLFFKHAFAFEYDNYGYYDGAVLEYSKNGGAWTDAKALFAAGKNYNGTVFRYPAGYEHLGSSLQGRSGFVGDSHGYVSSRYDLKSLAGQNVKFRWRFATDTGYWYWGWFVDDIKIYQCVGTPTVPTNQTPANNALTIDYTPLINWTDSTSSIHHYQIQIAKDSSFTDLAYDENNLPTSQFQVPVDLPSDTMYYWHVKSFNAIDGALGWSPTWTFRTALKPPALVSPIQNEHVLTLRPTFNWDDVPNATGYTIQISTSSAFTAPIVGNPMLSTFTPATDLPKGLLWWRVQTKGANGPSAWSEARSYNGINIPPAPTLTLPAVNALSTDYTPTFTWNQVVMPGVTQFLKYQIEVDNDDDFSSPAIQADSLTNNYTHGTGLPPNTKYYWRVRTVNTLDEIGNWSAVRTFRTALEVPVLSTPEESFDTVDLRPVFDWADVSNATGYTIQVSKNNTFTQMVLNVASPVSTYTPTVNIPANVTLYWRVLATGANGPSAPSDYRSFNNANPPSVPVLSLPAANALTTDYTPTLKWTAATLPAGATFGHYHVQVDNDADFSSPEFEDDTTLTDRLTSIQVDTTPLAPDTKFYWRVAAFNSDNESNGWSATRIFRTAILPPILITPPNATAVDTLKPFLDWGDVTGATSYTIQVSTSSTFATTLVNATVTPSTYIPTIYLPSGYVIFWRVRANGANGPSGWSTVILFTTP